MLETPTDPRLCPTDEELLANSRLRHGDLDKVGWSVRLRLDAGYFTPDEHYEVLVERLVRAGTRWLDVGCGRTPFPGNPGLAKILSERSEKFVGVDPDPAVLENPYVHERANCTVEAFTCETGFDVITLRMVAEHIADPACVVRVLCHLLRPGGHVIIYTVQKWALSAVAARWTPFRWHHWIKRVLWRTAERDTFPVAYRMNTRGRLRRLFAANGCSEQCYLRVPDARLFWRFPRLHPVELTLFRGAERIRIPYPENCILAVYRTMDVGQV